jgi:hypothetical protein
LNDPGFYRGKSAAPVTLNELSVFGPVIDKTISILLVAVTCYCFFHLWKSHLEIKEKIKWSFVIAIPLFGPMIYGYSNTKQKDNCIKVKRKSKK